MPRFLRTITALALASLAVLLAAGQAGAVGGRYVFDGGTAREQLQVRRALDASSFPWSIVPAQVTIHIVRGIPTSEAIRGEIWLDAALLDSGEFSWGVVQHEYAHQVDFFLLDDAKRAQLAPLLGGASWWAAAAPSLAPNGTAAHAQLTSERFASTLAWSYWQSSANSMQPHSATDESAAMAPAAFRLLVSRTLGLPAAR
jgi:hypothetical protein